MTNDSIADTTCLQEVDMHDDVIKDHMRGLNCDSLRTNSGDKVVICCVFWNEDERASCDCKLINFDDLSALSSSSLIASDNNSIDEDIDATKK